MTARRRLLLAATTALACGDDVQLDDGDTTAASSSSGGDTLPADSSTGEPDDSSSSSAGPMPSAECGNGVLEFGEDCDDARNGEPDDGCTDACTLPACGDGFVQSSLGEACDAGPDGDVFCGATCGSRHALQWLEEYGSRGGGNDDAYGVAIDGTGSVIVAGSAEDTDEGAIGRDLWVRKYGPDGRIAWTQVHDSEVGASNDYGYAVTVDAQGDVYVAGVVPVSGNGDDGIVLAFDAEGTPRWTAMHQGAAGNDDDIFAIAATDDGRLLVAGFVWDDPEALLMPWYGLLDSSDGSELFAQTIPAAPDEYGRLYAAAVGPSGELAVAGVLGQDNVVRVLESDGNERWTLDFHAQAENEDAARGVAFTADGGVLVAGAASYAYLRSFDGEGAELWSQVYGLAESSAHGLAITSDGVVVIVGTESSPGSSGSSPVLFGVDPEGGAEVWRNAPLLGAVVGIGWRVAAGADGTFAVVGSATPHIFDGTDLWVAAYRPQ